MTRLMSFWVRPMVAAKKAVEAADDGDDSERRRRVLEHRRQARDHEDAGGHHRGRVDQRRHRRRAFHRVRQPGVEAELGRLAHGAHEQQQAGDGQSIQVEAQEVHRRAPALSRRGGEHGVEVRPSRTGRRSP